MDYHHVARSNVIVDILRQNLNEAVLERLPTRHIRSPISIVKASNLNLEAVWNFGCGVAHSAIATTAESVPYAYLNTYV